MQVEVTYRRERGHNYILFPGAKEAGMQTEMIRRNKIVGLADFYTEWEDNQRYYGYDITGAKPFFQMFEVRALARKEAERLIEELAGIFQRMEPFLLDKDKLVLKPELLYVYTDRQGNIRSGRQGFLFFFCEEQEGSCEEHLRELVLYLFEKADETDPRLAGLLFRLYRLLARGEPDPEELLVCIGCQPEEGNGLGEASVPVDRGCQEEPCGRDGQAEGTQKNDKEDENRKRKRRKGLFCGKKGGLPRWLGKGPVPMEEMWDDLEPRRMPADVSLEKKEAIEEGEERPTEVLYMMEGSGGVPCLAGETGEEKIRLEHFPFYIGTQPGMDYCPEGHGVSRIHLKLEQRGGDIWVKDLNSTNGTSLNGEILSPNEERRLKDQDLLQLAGQVYRFDSGNESW